MPDAIKSRPHVMMPQDNSQTKKITPDAIKSGPRLMEIQDNSQTKKITPVAKDSINPPKKETKKEEESLWSTVVNWFWGLFYSDSKTAPTTDSLTTDPIQIKHKPDLKRPEHGEIRKVTHHLSDTDFKTKEINEEGRDYTKKQFDPYLFSTEIGLERAWVEAQIKQINLRKDVSHLDDDELFRLQKCIHIIKDKIDQLLGEKLKKGLLGKIFGYVGTGGTAVMLSCLIVMGGIAASVGTGNIPGILVVLQSIGAITSGCAQIVGALIKMGHNEVMAALMENKDDRQDALRKLQSLQDSKDQNDQVIRDAWALLKNVEEGRFMTLKDT